MTAERKKRNRACNLTAFELETVINFQGEKVSHIFTYELTWQKHLEKKSGLKPTLVNDSCGKGYNLPKTLIHMPQAKRHVSAERKTALQKILVEARQNRRANATTWIFKKFSSRHFYWHGDIITQQNM
jgi:hypothetical protein